MTTAINSEAHDKAMQVIKCTLTFASATQTVTTAHSYYGFVTQVYLDHGGTPPTTGYDIFVKDEYGVDVLNGKGVNITSSTDTFTYTQADLDNGMACSGQLTFSGADGGNSNGVVEIYLYIARYQ
jgi:hypothetical protein